MNTWNIGTNSNKMLKNMKSKNIGTRENKRRIANKCIQKLFYLLYFFHIIRITTTTYMLI